MQKVCSLLMGVFRVRTVRGVSQKSRGKRSAGERTRLPVPTSGRSRAG